MALSPEQKAQLAEQKKQCVFCKVITREIQTQVVFEDRMVEAILDVYPVTKGHTLFFPKEHYPILMYYEPQEITPFYGLIPQMVKSIKGATISTGVTLFVASGGAAGQQMPHFVTHIIPREPGDGFLNFLFKPRVELTVAVQEQMMRVFPAAMKQYFAGMGDGAFPEKGTRSTWVEDRVRGSLVLFEDSELIVCAVGKGICMGHVEVYSKIEQKFIEKLSASQAIHFFSICAYVSSVLFSVLQPQGTNFILKSGHSDDNKDGFLCMHIIARKQGDGLQGLVWNPEQPKYDLAGMGGKIKDAMWNVKYVAPATPRKVEEKVVEKVGDAKGGNSNTIGEGSTLKVALGEKSTGNEIDDAVRRLWGK